jgi:hypothetical protein
MAGALLPNRPLWISAACCNYVTALTSSSPTFPGNAGRPFLLLCASDPRPKWPPTTRCTTVPGTATVVSAAHALVAAACVTSTHVAPFAIPRQMSRGRAPQWPRLALL